MDRTFLKGEEHDVLCTISCHLLTHALWKPQEGDAAQQWLEHLRPDGESASCCFLYSKQSCPIMPLREMPHYTRNINHFPSQSDGISGIS